MKEFKDIVGIGRKIFRIRRYMQFHAIGIAWEPHEVGPGFSFELLLLVFLRFILYICAIYIKKQLQHTNTPPIT